MIALGLACFLAGLMVGLSIKVSGRTVSPGSSQSVREHRAEFSTAAKSVEYSAQKNLKPFRVRRSFAEKRAIWEKAHNTKAQMNKSLAQQIKQAQEGTLR